MISSTTSYFCNPITPNKNCKTERFGYIFFTLKEQNGSQTKNVTVFIMDEVIQ